MRLLTNDERDSFMEVPKRSREATLAEAADSGNESVMERRQDATGREALFLDTAELFVLPRDP
jgi:hypothetical protein